MRRGTKIGLSVASVVVLLAAAAFAALCYLVVCVLPDRAATPESEAQYVAKAAAVWRMANDTELCPTPKELVSSKIIDKLGGLDGWRGEYRITCSGQTVTVTSAGPDGVFGTSDDIAVGPPQ